MLPRGVSGDDHGGFVCSERGDGCHDVRLCHGIEPRGRVVQDEHLRVGGERPGKRDALALPAGKVQAGLPQRRVRQLACFVDTAEPAEDVLAVGGGERLLDDVLRHIPARVHVVCDGALKHVDGVRREQHVCALRPRGGGGVGTLLRLENPQTRAWDRGVCRLRPRRVIARVVQLLDALATRDGPAPPAGQVAER